MIFLVIVCKDMKREKTTKLMQVSTCNKVCAERINSRLLGFTGFIDVLRSMPPVPNRTMQEKANRLRFSKCFLTGDF